MDCKLFLSGLTVCFLAACDDGGSDSGGDDNGAGKGEIVNGCIQLARSVELQRNVWVHTLRNSCSKELNTLLASNDTVRNIPALGTAEYNANSANVATFSCASPDKPRRVSATKFTCDKR